MYLISFDEIISSMCSKYPKYEKEKVEIFLIKFINSHKILISFSKKINFICTVGYAGNFITNNGPKQKSQIKKIKKYPI